MATPAQQMLAAVQAGDAAAVAELLAADLQLANLSERSDDRRSVLHQAATLGHVDIIELLLAAGATVDKHAHDGSTPLHAAASAGHLSIVKLLIQAGANPQARTNSHTTPFSEALRKGHHPVANYLRELLHPQQTT